MTETNHGILDYTVLVLRQFWKVYPMISVTEVKNDRNYLSFQLHQTSRVKIIEDGGVICTLTPEQQAERVKAMKPVWVILKIFLGSCVNGIS